MSVKIRLARHGRRKAPYYRMVVADTRFPRDGRFIEPLGIYQPLVKDSAQQFRVDEGKALAWLAKGAIPTNTCRSILRKLGIMQKFHEQSAATRSGTAPQPASPAVTPATPESAANQPQTPNEPAESSRPDADA